MRGARRTTKLATPVLREEIARRPRKSRRRGPSQGRSWSVAGPISRYLADDHSRLDAVLRRATAPSGEVDRAAYASFRAGLLRHISMEEKILLPAARRARRGEALPIAAQLRRDHAALASLLVPTPTPEILRLLRELLDVHNPLEEGPSGVYEACDLLLAADAEALAACLRRSPEVRVAPHYDGPRLHGHVGALLRAARGRSPRSP
ncbi:MAG: hemerythrin domain-containing protein [Planctomycetia bacterium]|nr:hemerythrin domain-containing protein [Planctomycetia bacterium]